MMQFDYEPSESERTLILAIRRAKQTWRDADAADHVWNQFAVQVVTAQRASKPIAEIVMMAEVFAARLRMASQPASDKRSAIRHSLSCGSARS